jgi:hypothetical protein
MKTKLLILCGTLALAVASAHAASISYSLTAPTAGAYDIFNLTGAANDGANVNDGGVYADGNLNDAFTYVAFDRGAQGQTFTTGGFLSGYTINAIWMQHAGYTANTDLTWYMDPAGSDFQIRVTDPSQSGNAGFVLGSEIATTTGSELNTLPLGIVNSANGTGTWLRFGFGTPLTLGANTTCGFDVSAPGSFGGFGVQPFFETLGTSSDALGGGAAYSSGANGSGGDNILTARVGDRVFLVELTPVPEPSTFALIGLGGLAAVLLRRRSALQH